MIAWLGFEFALDLPEVHAPSEATPMPAIHTNIYYEPVPGSSSARTTATELWRKEEQSERIAFLRNERNQDLRDGLKGPPLAPREGDTEIARRQEQKAMMEELLRKRALDQERSPLPLRPGPHSFSSHPSARSPEPSRLNSPGNPRQSPVRTPGHPRTEEISPPDKASFQENSMVVASSPILEQNLPQNQMQPDEHILQTHSPLRRQRVQTPPPARMLVNLLVRNELGGAIICPPSSLPSHVDSNLCQSLETGTGVQGPEKQHHENIQGIDRENRTSPPRAVAGYMSETTEGIEAGEEKTMPMERDSITPLAASIEQLKLARMENKELRARVNEMEEEARAAAGMMSKLSLSLSSPDEEGRRQRDAVAERERAVREREEDLARKVRALTEREKVLEAREAAVTSREEAVAFATEWQVGLYALLLTCGRALLSEVRDS